VLVSRKSQYALRAVFELAKRGSADPVRVADIAEAQSIPVRFLEAILNQLRQAGVVESRRGKDGGYLLEGRPSAVTVGDVLRAVDGETRVIDCGNDPAECPSAGQCVFHPLWDRAKGALDQVYDSTTVADLVDEEVASMMRYAPVYSI